MSHGVKPVMSEEFRFIPKETGPAEWIGLGVLAVVAGLLILANVNLEGEFDIWSVILPVVMALTLGAMFPQIRYIQRTHIYKRYLRELPKERLEAAMASDLDAKSKDLVEEVLFAKTQSARTGGSSSGFSDGGGGSCGGGDGGGGC